MGRTTKNEADILLCYCVSIGEQTGRHVRHRHCLKSSGSTKYTSSQTNSVFTFYTWKTRFSWGQKQRMNEVLLPALHRCVGFLPISLALLTENSVTLCRSLCKQANTEGVKRTGIWVTCSDLTFAIQTHHAKVNITLLHQAGILCFMNGHLYCYSSVSASVLKTNIDDYRMKQTLFFCMTCPHLCLFLLSSLCMSL